jgi:CheY-like chemotaxis protein
MAKIMLVEDDNNLREIYQARLAAEGYEIVTAKDGEEALAVAVKEKPDLVVCDVMMPKVSGFEMLDILRSTSGIKDTKVIMMTALSQAEDKARAEKLGADRYLVKSQVTLEDMAKAVQDVLNGVGENGAQPGSSDSSSPEQLLTNAADKLSQASTPAPVRPEDRPMNTSVSTSQAAIDAPITEGRDESTSDGVSIARKKVIQPLNDLSKPSNNLDALLAKEEAREQLEKGGAATQPAIINGQVADDSSATTDDTPPVGQVIAPGGDGAVSSDPNSIAL